MNNKYEDLELVKKWVNDLFGVTAWKTGSTSFLPYSVLLHNTNKELLYILYASLDLFSIQHVTERYNIVFHQYAHAGDVEIFLGGTTVACVWFDFFEEVD